MQQQPKYKPSVVLLSIAMPTLLYTHPGFRDVCFIITSCVDRIGYLQLWLSRPEEVIFGRLNVVEFPKSHMQSVCDLLSDLREYFYKLRGQVQPTTAEEVGAQQEEIRMLVEKTVGTDKELIAIFNFIFKGCMYIQAKQN